MRCRQAIFASIGASAFLFACAIDPGPFFTPPALPEKQSAFNGGQIGLLTPALTKENELIAFRLLSGLKMGLDFGGRKRAVPMQPGTIPPEGQQAWLEKRRTIADPRAPLYIDAYRTTGQYVYYQNCLPDAFETAARTFEDRRAKYGSATAIKNWVVAQDQVFVNCNSVKPTYPDALPGTASPLERADRDYQIAAAHFYAEDFAEAEQRFRKIADDQNSPWRHIGSYLVARTLLREASLKNDSAALPKARHEFMNIEKDPAATSLAASAKQLLEHLDAVEHPHAAMESLSQQVLSTAASADSIENAIGQSAFVLRATSFQSALSQADVPEAFDWVETLERGSAEHAVQRWRDRKSAAWLTLALMYASGKDSAVPELLEASDHIGEASPAFGTAVYNSIRVRIERGDTDRARKQLDQLLRRKSDQPESLVNGWRAERMRVATSFDDLLRWAPRRPIGAGTGKPNSESPTLAHDSAYVLNRLTPLAKLNHAAHSNLLPPWSAADVALAAWTRAFMLDDLDTARELAAILSKQHPEWQSGLTPPSGADADRWKFEAALLILLHRQFQPLVSVNYASELGSSGSWWCPVEAQSANQNNGGNENSISWRLPVVFTPSKDVLSRDDVDTAAREIAELRKKGSTEMFLAPIVFSWAKAHPSDPKVPEALHRLVMVTRYGCRNGDPAIGKISKAAFDLLHENYPKSPWTMQTPYWFH